MKVKLWQAVVACLICLALGFVGGVGTVLGVVWVKSKVNNPLQSATPMALPTQTSSPTAAMTETPTPEVSPTKVFTATVKAILPGGATLYAGPSGSSQTLAGLFGALTLSGGGTQTRDQLVVQGRSSNGNWLYGTVLCDPSTSGHGKIGCEKFVWHQGWVSRDRVFDVQSWSEFTAENDIPVVDPKNPPVPVYPEGYESYIPPTITPTPTPIPVPQVKVGQVMTVTQTGTLRLIQREGETSWMPMPVGTRFKIQGKTKGTEIIGTALIDGKAYQGRVYAISFGNDLPAYNPAFRNQTSGLKSYPIPLEGRSWYTETEISDWKLPTPLAPEDF